MTALGKTLPRAARALFLIAACVSCIVPPPRPLEPRRSERAPTAASFRLTPEPQASVLRSHVSVLLTRVERSDEVVFSGVAVDRIRVRSDANGLVS